MIRVNLIFGPMHLNGVSGMPRRYGDFADQFRVGNWTRTYGRVMAFINVVVFFFLV